MPFHPQVKLVLTPSKDASLYIRDNYGKLQLLKTQRTIDCGVCSSNGYIYDPAPALECQGVCGQVGRKTVRARGQGKML